MADQDKTELPQEEKAEVAPDKTEVPTKVESEAKIEEIEVIQEVEVKATQEEVAGQQLIRSRKPTPLTTWQKIKRSIYNPDTRAVLGRNCASWGRLSLFYAIFYGILASMCAISMKVFLDTMTLTAPKWKLGESLIGTNPGLGFRPISPNTEEGALIWYNSDKPATTEKWVKLLDEFLEPYQKNYTDSHMKFCNFEKEFDPSSVCFVDTDHFGPCTSNNKYGYNGSSPCVFIKLNKIFGWIPKFYTKPVEGMPSDLIEEMKNLPMLHRRQIWITCNGEDPVDRENIQGFNYYPSRGLPGYFYPYLNLKNYLSPLIAVQIVNPKPNVLVNIECRAWAKNIFYKGGKLHRQGSVHFEILKDTK